MSGEYNIGVGIYEDRFYSSADHLIDSQTHAIE